MDEAFEPELDVTPADWMVERLWRWGADVGTRVGALIPEVFEAYARILHTPEPHNRRPHEGTLIAQELDALIGILGPFTASFCWFCVWYGYGWWTSSMPFRRMPDGIVERLIWTREAEQQQRRERQALDRFPTVRTQGRQYFLFRGPIDAARTWMEFPAWQSPNIWWPDDRSWCVATEIDLDSTLVGGSRELIDAITDASDLEALEISLETRLDWLGDELNLDGSVLEEDGENRPPRPDP